MKEYTGDYKRTKYTNRQKRKIWNYLRPEEITRLDRYLESKMRDRIIFRLMYRCGLRVGEVVGGEYDYEVAGGVKAHSVLPGIHSTDFDFERRNLVIHGKGDLDRQIPIHPDLVSDILVYLTKERNWDGFSDIPLIAKHHKSESITTANVRFVWSGIKKRLNIRPVVRVHDLRHTFAMEYLRNGGDIRDLKELMGHASLDQTMAYASKLKEETREDARKVIDQMARKP